MELEYYAVDAIVGNEISEWLQQNLTGRWSKRYGLRMTFNYLPGDHLNASFKWDEKNDVLTNERYPGTSCVYLGESPDDIPEAVDEALALGGPHLILIKGDFVGFGRNGNEILLAGAVVVKRWEIEHDHV